jgi:hypothetical protein
MKDKSPEYPYFLKLLTVSSNPFIDQKMRCKTI